MGMMNAALRNLTMAPGTSDHPFEAPADTGGV
jgi:hypothetical protein